MSTDQDLASRQCVPCRGGVPPLAPEAQWPLKRRIHDDWKLVDGHHLSRTWSFPDFASALEFVNRVGEKAEEQGHHPNVYLAWGEVRLDVWTHKIDGLTESDFVFAAHVDRLPA